MCSDEEEREKKNKQRETSPILNAVRRIFNGINNNNTSHNSNNNGYGDDDDDVNVLIECIYKFMDHKHIHMIFAHVLAIIKHHFMSILLKSLYSDASYHYCNLCTPVNHIHFLMQIDVSKSKPI